MTSGGSWLVMPPLCAATGGGSRCRDHNGSATGRQKIKIRLIERTLVSRQRLGDYGAACGRVCPPLPRVGGVARAEGGGREALVVRDVGGDRGGGGLVGRDLVRGDRGDRVGADDRRADHQGDHPALGRGG